MNKIFLTFTIPVLFLGCASGPSIVHSSPLGSEAIVNLSEDIEVKQGDILDVFKKNCEEQIREGHRSFVTTRTVCTKYLVGQAKVTNLKSNKEAIISSLGTFTLEEGMIAEKTE